MITHKQLFLADIFTDCQNKFDYDKYQFLELLENTINLDEIVPASFVSHFHAATGRPRKHLLYPMLKALLLQLIFSIPTTSLLDDEFMTIVFDRNTETTELLLNIILGRNDMEVTEVVAQREYKNPVTGGRSIKLDIYAKGSDGKVYDIEVQNENAGADVRRARFHSSMLDTKMLKEKQKFREIHESYVIFITKNDYMKMGLPLYHVERTIQESGALFGDGAHIIYVNGSYKNDSDPVGKLIHDFRCTSAVDMFYQELAKSVRHFKETEGGRSQMSKTMEERINREKDKERIDCSYEYIKNLVVSSNL